MSEHNALGRWGEQKAAEYLERQGYRIMWRDWRDGHRDLDIVAIDADELVIVEVKTRRNNRYIEPEEAVDRMKMLRMVTAANKFAKGYRIEFPMRFDIVAVIGTDDDNCVIRHIEDAFNPWDVLRRNP